MIHAAMHITLHVHTIHVHAFHAHAFHLPHAFHVHVPAAHHLRTPTTRVGSTRTHLPHLRPYRHIRRAPHFHIGL